MEDVSYKTAQKQRDDLLKRIEKTLECKDVGSGINNITSCHQWLKFNFTPTVSESTKDSCRHLYHPKYIHDPSTLNLATSILRETSVTVGSYSTLHGDLLEVDSFNRQTTPDFVYDRGSTFFSPYVFFCQECFAEGPITSAIYNPIDEKSTPDFSSFWEVIRNATSDFIEITSDPVCFAKNNRAFIVDFIPPIELDAIYGGVDLIRNIVGGNGTVVGGNGTVLVKRFYEWCYNKTWCSEWHNFPPREVQKKDTLLEAALDAKNRGVKGFGGSTLVYSNQVIFELKFSLVSVTINLVEDEESRRDVTEQKAIYEGRACFFKFAPTAISNPEVNLNTTFH